MTDGSQSHGALAAIRRSLRQGVAARFERHRIGPIQVGCTGSCPNCSHSGGYGADCSGYVAKAWQIPSSNINTTVESHRYSTATFVGSDSQWSTVARGDAKLRISLNVNTWIAQREHSRSRQSEGVSVRCR